MKKLLMISTDRNIFSEGSAVSKRMEAIGQNFDELNIVVFTNKSYKEISLASNVFVYPTRSISKWFYHLGAIRIGRFVCERRGITDITCQDPFLTTMAGVSLSKTFKLPLEIQIHTDIGSPEFVYTLGNRIRKMLANIYLPRASHIRVVSQRIKSYLVSERHIDERVIEVRPIHVDVVRIKSAPITVDLHKKYPQFEKIILMASRLEREKDIGLAIKASTVISKIASDMKIGLVIVGDGSEESRLKKMVDDLNLGNMVVFEKWQMDVASYYKTTDLFLVTSLYEGYGMTLVEAHAGGCPIVSTDVGVAREFGANIVTREPESIANAIISILK